MLVSACGSFSSRINPFNWGRHASAPQEDTLTPKGGYPAMEPTGPLVPKVTALKVERTPTGAIVRATGLPPYQGYWDGSLAATNDGEPDQNGVMTYRFILKPPPAPTNASTAASREVSVGAYLSASKLRRIRQIVVEAQSNRMTARR